VSALLPDGSVTKPVIAILDGGGEVSLMRKDLFASWKSQGAITEDVDVDVRASHVAGGKIATRGAFKLTLVTHTGRMKDIVCLLQVSERANVDQLIVCAQDRQSLGWELHYREDAERMVAGGDSLIKTMEGESMLMLKRSRMEESIDQLMPCVCMCVYVRGD